MVADDVGEVREERLNALTWEREVTDIATPSHRERIAFLTENAGARIDETAYVAAAAQIYTSQLKLGAHSWIAGHALVRGDIEFGAHCTVNPYACISGKVRCGDGVRIASLASIVGFNHGFDDPDLPIHMQPHETLGITIADDVWIGANAVILDGVTIGRGAVVAAGAVVSRDIPEMTIVAGVPAKPVRQRGAASAPKSRRTQVQNALENIGRVAGAEWRDVLATNRQGDDYLSLEADGIARHSIRHLCDAIEIAAGFGSPPEGHTAQDAIARLQAVQDRVTGLFPDPFRPPAAGVALRSDDLALYNVLAVGYALETLGARPVHPVAAVEIDARDLCAWLEALPWTTNAWGAGAHVDAIGTGLYLNARHFTSNRARETLFGWLAMKIDRSLGLWGAQTQREGLLLPVNGFYRLTRGTYAQFGVPVPLPEAAINSVLTNYRNNSGFQEATYTACNLLDTIHPLWLCRNQTDHRRADIEAVAEDIILRAPSRWQLGKGFPFRDGQPGSLQGTEMWLSVLHLAADTLGIAELFPFAPKGVHRTSTVGLGL